MQLKIISEIKTKRKSSQCHVETNTCQLPSQKGKQPSTGFNSLPLYFDQVKYTIRRLQYTLQSSAVQFAQNYHWRISAEKLKYIQKAEDLKLVLLQLKKNSHKSASSVERTFTVSCITNFQNKLYEESPIELEG